MYGLLIPAYLYSRSRAPRRISRARLANTPLSLARSLACYKEIAVFTGMGKMFEISVNNSTCSAHTQITSRTLYRTIF